MKAICRDCGQGYEPSYHKGRMICPECFRVRIAVVKARESGAIGPAEFTKLQRKMASRTPGVARRAMDAALGEEVGE